MKKRKILATGGIITSMLIAGVSPTFAQTTRPSKVTSTITRESLIEEGFSASQIHKIITTTNTKSKGKNKQM